MLDPLRKDPLALIFTILFIALGVGIFQFVATEPVGGADLAENFGLDSVGNGLAALFFMALVLERAQEVIMTGWRGPLASQYELAVETTQQTFDKWRDQVESVLEDGNEPTPEQLNGLELQEPKLADAQRDLMKYKLGTRHRALITGVGLGVLASLLGLRTMEMILEPAADGMTRGFYTFDVIVTGLLLAGGSDAINKVTKAFTDFAESSSKKSKKSATTN